MRNIHYKLLIFIWCMIGVLAMHLTFDFGPTLWWLFTTFAIIVSTTFPEHVGKP